MLRMVTDVGSGESRDPDPDVAAVETSVIDPEALDALLDSLRARGFRVLGPTVREGAIVYDDLGSAAELPIGWTDSQDGGRYRLERRDDEARFGYAVGPHSWKQFLLPARLRLWRARRDGEDGFEVEEEPTDDTPLAFVGVRACELHAIDIQDRVFLGGSFADRDYAARRDNAFLVAVNCFEAGGTCFCVSMGTGPRAESGYDLALTEILDGGHRFLVEAGSERGAEVLAELPDDIEVLEREGEPTGLISEWATADEVWLVDAVSSGAAPGTVHRIDAAERELPAAIFRASTHHLGVPEAVEIARALGRLPARLVVHGIEGATFDAGRGLTPQIEEALERVIAAVGAELEAVG